MPIRDPQRAFFIPVLIPLGTTAPANPAAFATYGLMTANVIAFLAGLIAPGMIDHLALYSQGAIYRAATYAFIHEPSFAGFGHLLFNMLFLWIFAVPLESKIGSWRLLALYLICAVAGAIAWNIIQATHGLPMLGSSAAVWGLMGAYLILWPYSSVRCYFVLLALIVPIFARTWNTLAILFPVFYYLFIGVMIFCAWLMDLDPLIEHVAWSAHAGGMLAGAALAAAAYGFGSFRAKQPEPQPAGADADDFEVPSILAPPKPAAPAPKPQTTAQVSPKWTALQEAVILGESDAAVRLWHEQMKPELNDCLMPGPQLDLARMLSRAGETDEAIEALDRLLRIHHNCELAPLASLELARLLLDNHRDPEIIASLLDTIEAANPAIDVLQEVEEMRSRLANPHPTPRPFFTPPAEKAGEPAPESADEEPIEPREKPAASFLFGDPEDTGAFDLNIEKSEPRATPPEPVHEDTTPPSEIKIQLAKFEDDDPDATRKPFKPATSAIHAEPDYKYNEGEEDPFARRKSILDPSGRVRNETFEPAAPVAPRVPVQVMQPEPLHVAPDKDHVPTAEIFIGGITHFPEQPDVSDTNEQPLFLRQSIRYAAILTPGRPVNIPLVCEVLRPLLGLGPEPTHHAILRRRGILAEDLLAVEAEALANTLCSRGQSITIVAMDKHVDFGPALDVMAYMSEGSAGRFSVPGQALTCRWATSVLFAAGLVRLNPTSPGRAVLDLFFSHPRVHLRLWESTMVYPDRIINTARVLETIYASAPGGIERLPLRRDWCFRALSAEIEEHGRNAIRTRSLSDWLGQSAPLPNTHFWSQIEYDNFLRWHLLAYHAPKKTYG